MVINLSNNDFYSVYNDYYDYNYSKELNILYLPIIGINAVKLYNFFSCKILNDNNLSNNMLHFDITDNLSIDLKQFKLARKKLEAIGLLKTYFLEKDSKSIYIYKLNSPMSFDKFLSEPLLSTVLENAVGSSEYKVIFKKYSTNKVSFENFKEITSKFSEVYSTSQLDDYSFNNILNLEHESKPNFDEYYFDFDKLNYLLANNYLGDLLDNKNLKNAILSLAHLYKITPYEMAGALEKSLDVSSGGTEIDLEKLKNYLVQLFINVKKQDVPTLDKMLNKQLIKETYSEEKELSKKEKLAQIFDSYNYVQFLNKRHSIILSETDGKNITNIQTKYNMPTGVLNVLLDYAITESKSQGVPNFGYLDKIASTWSSSKLTSALDAINFVNNQRKNYTHNKLKKEENKNNITNVVTNRKNNNRHIVKTPNYIKEQLDSLSDENYKTRQINQKDEEAHENFKKLLKEKGID